MKTLIALLLLTTAASAQGVDPVPFMSNNAQTVVPKQQWRSVPSNDFWGEVPIIPTKKPAWQRVPPDNMLVPVVPVPFTLSLTKERVQELKAYERSRPYQLLEVDWEVRRKFMRRTFRAARRRLAE